MKKSLFFSLFLLSIFVCVQAQTSCFKPTYDRGVAEYKKGNYEKAKSIFNEAKKCFDCSPRMISSVNQKIKDCDNAIKRKNRPTTPPKKEEATTAAPVDNPNVKKPKIRAITTELEVGCVKSRMGVRVTADFKAENLKGQEIFAECIVKPDENESVSEKYRDTEFDVRGKSGQRGRTIYVEESFEPFSDIFFIPFGAMSLEYYGEQTFEVLINIYQSSNPNTPIQGGTFKGSISTEPVTLWVDDDVSDQYVALDHNENYVSFKIDVCGNVDWYDVPSWIRASKATLHIEENEEPSPREAYLTIRSRDGGNEIHVFIQQGGAPEKVIVQKPLAAINDVRLEHNVIGADGHMNTIFHVDVDISGQKGKEVLVCARYFNADGKTELIDKNGEKITGQATVTPSYNDSNYGDVRFRVDNLRVFKAKNLQKNEIKIIVGVSFDGGNTWVAESDPRTVTW